MPTDIPQEGAVPDDPSSEDTAPTVVSAADSSSEESAPQTAQKALPKIPRLLIVLLLALGVGIPGGVLGYSFLDLQQAEVKSKGFIEYAQQSTQNPRDLLHGTSDRAEFEVAGDVNATIVGTQELPVRISEGPFSKETSVAITVKDTQPPVITLKAPSLTTEMGSTPKVSDVVTSVADPVDGELKLLKSEPKARGSKPGAEKFYDEGWYLVDFPESVGEAGSYTIGVTACDQHGNKASQTLSLDVTDPLDGVTLEAKTDVLEYSNKSVDPITLVTCSDPKAKVKATNLDISSVGEKKVTYTLSKGKSIHKITHTFTVCDTKKPTITLNATAVSIDNGASFDPFENVKSVTDEVDGDLSRMDSEPAENGGGWFTVKGTYDVNKSGKYFLTVVACDKNGNRVEEEYSLEVKEPTAPATTSMEGTGAPGATSEGQDYVLNTNTHKFHYPSCGHADTIRSYNRQDVHMTREEIVARGYTPCAHCSP
ncbi:MAG: hypothetical protein Q4A07_10500 [Coriobacteriales bacterium]|nr:hypothetical protein [Coriobacteriales bacterium]